MSATFYDLGEKILAVCPKAGSQSIRKALLTDLGVRELQMHSIKETPKRQEKPVAWFVRHPIKRLASCFRYFAHTVGWPGDTPVRASTYETFVDAVLSGECNRHWDPQTPQVTYTRFFLPTEVYRFEDINTLWNDVVGRGTLRHENPSTPIELNTSYRLDELEAFYREDLHQWQHASTADTRIWYEPKSRQVRS